MFNLGLVIEFILIICVFVFLYWFAKKEWLNNKSSIVMLSVSLVSFLVFPRVLGLLGMQTSAFILLLFVLFGLEMVIVIEKKQKSEQRLDLKASLWSFAKVVKSFNLTEKLKNIGNVVNLKKIEEYITKKEPVMSNSFDSMKQEEKETNNEKSLEKEILSNETLSYVDFDDKTEKSGDVFTRFIRGEIPLNEVKDKLIQGFDKKNGEGQEDNQIKKPETDSLHEEVTPEESNGAVSDNSVEGFIDLAFQAKVEGRFMDAIELYIQALEKKPDDQLVLWIVIDVCSLYRQLGQEELAKEMIESYIESAGDTLNQQMKEEIIANFNIEI